MKLGVENLGTLSNAAFNIPRALHQFYFILPIRAWVGSFRIKKMYSRFNGHNAELFLQGQKSQDLKIFREQSHFPNMTNTQTTHIILLMFSLD